MPSNAELFKNMHADTSPLLLVNVWDPASALVAQSLGAVALGTSSAALAWSLGYRDGELLPVDELLAAFAIIQKCRSGWCFCAGSQVQPGM